MILLLEPNKSFAQRVDPERSNSRPLAKYSVRQSHFSVNGFQKSGRLHLQRPRQRDIVQQPDIPFSAPDGGCPTAWIWTRRALSELSQHLSIAVPSRRRCEGSLL